ncbi:hypothetical protein B0H14DRAFT_3020216 [Mycena olivaceomarginata]|nr:hypothetical protein B0H14DRAFT_3020216 [Mycena olivaceomarginata]
MYNLTASIPVYADAVVPDEASIVAILSRVAASIFATRYISAAAVTILFYDHILSFSEEVEIIWFNKAAGAGNRISFLANRYLTEGMMVYDSYVLSGLAHGMTTNCRIFIWLFGITGTVWISISHFIIMSRLYTLWDRRREIKWILMGSFAIAISVATAFDILTSLQAEAHFQYNNTINMCTFTDKIWAMPFLLGTLTIFDLFIIVMTVINGFHRPYQKQADVMVALQRDGAMMFLVILRLVNLFMAILGDATDFTVAFEFVWAMCAIVSSRIQLRVEGLRFIRHAFPAGMDTNGLELFETRQHTTVLVT